MWVMIMRATVPILAAMLAASAGAALAADPPYQVAAGKLIAQRNCGVCHAVGVGPSPLAAAPPFRELYHRYPPGGLEQILEEGMLAPTEPPEEGAPRRHPRMPQFTLGPDEVANLKAYLKSLEPAN